MRRPARASASADAGAPRHAHAAPGRRRRRPKRRIGGRTGGAGGRGGTARPARGWRDGPPAAPERRIAWREYYLTTAIDYANGDPHLGHAFEKIGADAIARYHRLLGDDVWFLIGMDEHGQKVAQTAADRGVSPQELVDEVAETFQAMWRRLGISNDQFIRTTAPAHKQGVQALIERIFEKQPERLLREVVRGLVLRRLRVVQAGRTRSSTATACCTPRARSSGWRSATGSSG